MFLGPVQEGVISEQVVRRHAEEERMLAGMPSVKTDVGSETGEAYKKSHVVKLPQAKRALQPRDKVANNLDLKSGKSWATKGIEKLKYILYQQ